MAIVFEIVLGLLILASFFVAYMSSKTWPIYQVIIAEFVFLGTVVFMYLAARTLATHDSWRNLVQQREGQLANLETQIREVNEGGAIDPQSGQPSKGIRELKLQLAKLAIDRGNVLRDVTVDGVENGLVKLTLSSANHGLVPNTVLFAFDQKPAKEGGRYWGEFKVTSVAEEGPGVEIAPNLPLTESQAQALASATGPWTFYASMPIDDAERLAALDDAAREALLPPESLEEYSKADRRLRDYEAFFHENYVQRALLTDSIAKLNSNIERTVVATEEATKEIGYRETELANLKVDLEKFQHEQRAIAAYHASLAKRYQQVRESLKSTYLSARGRAAQLTAEQFQAAQEIDRRSRAAATR